MDLEIPPINANLDDHERNAVLLTASVSAKPLNNELPAVQKQTELNITLYNEVENIVPDINEQV